MKINKIFFKAMTDLSRQLKRKFGVVDSILDIGCGIRPFGWVKSKSIVCVEPFDDYRKRLTSSFSPEKLITIKASLESVCDIVNPSEFSMVTLIDVIEHLPKDIGETALKSLIRNGAKTILVFTPDGFMPQHAHKFDAWGFSSGNQQEHLSGWSAEDFLALGFNDFWCIENLHSDGNKKWHGMLAIYEQKNIYKHKYGFWDPAEQPNDPPKNVKTLIVFGRHNRYSGTVSGTHADINFACKIYIPSFGFMPNSIRKIYKKIINLILSMLCYL